MISPVTGKAGVVKKSFLLPRDIAKLYQDKFQINVNENFIGLNEIEILQCIETGYLFYHPYNISGNAEFYEELQKAINDKEKYYRLWGYDHQFAFDRIKTGQVVLDVGCGSGNFLARIKEKTSQAVGLEFNNVAIEKCRKAGITVYPDSIEEHAEKFFGYYDVICLFQVLEHIHNVKPFLEACLKALKPGGRLIIGVPNNEPYSQRFNKYSPLNLPPHHMGLWNKKVFERIQPVFNINLIETAYEAKGRLLLDIYFRTKLWWDIKSLFQQHSLLEKLKMISLAPLATTFSLFKKFTSGINGGYIVVEFEK